MSSEQAALDGLTLRFAEHLASSSYDDLPADVVEKAKLILRDGVGNEVAASAIAEPAQRMVALVSEWGGAEDSTIVGYGRKVPLPHAAMCNAMMGHGIELDDAHGSGLIKAGSVLVPSAFAAAEKSGASGRDVVAAIVGAYDIAVRIAKAINPGHRKRGYHTTGTVSAIASAGLTAKLLGCDAEGIAWAIGLGAMQSAGIQSYLDDPCMAKPFSPGKAAFNGTLAGVMASRGFTGPKKVLESKEGFFNAFTDSVRIEDLAPDTLGSHWSIMEVGFKPHAACRYAHGPIDLAQRAYHESGVRLDDVAKVTVGMSEMAIRQASKPRVTNLNAAMGSTQFSIALALEKGANGLKEYWETFPGTRVHEGARHVELEPDPEYGLTGRQSRLAIELQDGRTLSFSSLEPKGEPTNPLTADELEQKYLAMTTMVVDEAHARRLADIVMSLESQENASAIPQNTVIADGPALREAS